MNRYKIELKNILKKEINLDAKDPKEALNLVEKIYLESDILDFKGDDIEEIEANIIEENGEKIETIQDLNKEDCKENQTIKDLEDEKILEKFLTKKLEKAFEIIEEKMENPQKNSKEFKDKIEKFTNDFCELIELIPNEENITI